MQVMERVMEQVREDGTRPGDVELVDSIAYVDVDQYTDADQYTDVGPPHRADMHLDESSDTSIQRRGTELSPADSSGKHRRLMRWQFWVFVVFPTLLAIGVSAEVFYLAYKREISQAQDDFLFSARMVHTNMNRTLQTDIESAHLLLGTLLANSVVDLPSPAIFENMVFNNPFFNIDNTVAKVIFLESVANASREAWPLDIVTLPHMKAAWGNQPRISSPPNLNYLPVRFVSPPQEDFMGLDFSTDPVNGPYLRLAKGMGTPTITHAFALRGGIPGQPDDLLFKNGAVYHMPIFQSLTPDTGAFTSEHTDVMKGVLSFVFWLTGVLGKTMNTLELRHTDVFLFDITDADNPSYVAHFESPENTTRPFYTPTNITTVTPFNLEYDFLSPWDAAQDLVIAQRRYRLLVRGRTGNYANRFSTNLPYILLALSLGVKLVDKLFGALHHSKWCNEHHEHP